MDCSGYDLSQINKLVRVNILFRPVADSYNKTYRSDTGRNDLGRNHFAVLFGKLVSASLGAHLPKPHIPAFIIAVFTVIVQFQGQLFRSCGRHNIDKCRKYRRKKHDQRNRKRFHSLVHMYLLPFRFQVVAACDFRFALPHHNPAIEDSHNVPMHITASAGNIASVSDLGLCSLHACSVLFCLLR